jgi:hypothetical protein
MNLEPIPLDTSKKPLGTPESLAKAESGARVNPAIAGVVEHPEQSLHAELMYNYLRQPTPEGMNQLLNAAKTDYLKNPRHEKLPDTGDERKDFETLRTIVFAFTAKALERKKPANAELAYAEFLDQFTNAIRLDADAKRKAAAAKKNEELN